MKPISLDIYPTEEVNEILIILIGFAINFGNMYFL